MSGNWSVDHCKSVFGLVVHHQHCSMYVQAFIFINDGSQELRRCLWFKKLSHARVSALRGDQYFKSSNCWRGEGWMIGAVSYCRLMQSFWSRFYPHHCMRREGGAGV